MRARTAAVRALAGLATLALGGSGWAHYSTSAGFKSTAVAANWEAAGARMPGVSRERPQHLQLAADGESWLSTFFNNLFGIEPGRPQYRRVPQPVPRRAPRREAPAPSGGMGGAFGEGAAYRTMCVRLCDGYYWPVSFATSRDSFARDQKTCTQSCSASATLYYHANPGGGPEDMVSLHGLAYTDLGTAFLYRTVYDPNCKCRPHPWEAEAVERHKRYASPAKPRAVANSPRRAQRAQ